MPRHIPTVASYWTPANFPEPCYWTAIRADGSEVQTVHQPIIEANWTEPARIAYRKAQTKKGHKGHKGHDSRVLGEKAIFPTPEKPHSREQREETKDSSLTSLSKKLNSHQV